MNFRPALGQSHITGATEKAARKPRPRTKGLQTVDVREAWRVLDKM